jgi:hypothetical protein
MGEVTMKRTVAASHDFAPSAREWARDDRWAMDLPKGRTGLVLLSETGRKVWWTGRVAIGLRYEPPPRGEPHGRSALGLRGPLLKRG